MALLGRRVASKNQVMQVGSGTGVPRLAATIYGPAPANLWVTAFGGWVGTRGTPDQDLTIGAYAVDAAGAPTTWLGEAAFTVDETLNAGGAGETVELRQTVSGTGLSNQGIPIAVGSYVAIYVFSTDAVAVSYTDDAAAAIRTRGDVASVPDLFGAHTVVAGRALDLYVEATVNNDEPVVNYAYLRDDLANGNHRLSPFFNPSGAFAIWGGEAAVNFDPYDLVDAAHGDEIAQVKLQLAPRPDDAGVVWEQTLTKGEFFPVLEASSFGTSPVYDLVATYTGPKLAPGAYFCRAQFADHFGAWSDWTPWLSGEGTAAWAVWIDRTAFYLAMTPGLAPLGRVTAENPATFSAIYGASSTVAATHAHLLISTVGNVIDAVVISEVVEVAISPGGTITIPWDEGWPDLAPGNAYAYRIRAIHQPDAPNDDRRYVSNAPDWQYFSLNGLPEVPTSLIANNALGVGGRPLLTAVAGDLDDTPATGFGVRFRITRPDTSEVTVNATLVPGTTNQWRVQTDAAMVPDLGAYDWEAQSFNGDDVSEWSAPAAFTYAAAPEVAITSPDPDEIISGDEVPVTWTTDGTQTAYRVRVFEADTDALAYDSGTVVADDQELEVPTSGLRHATDYELSVESTDDLGLIGVAGPVAFTVQFALPATPANFTVTPTQLPGDSGPTVNTLSWDAVEDADFTGYRVSRQAITDGDDGLDEIDLWIGTDSEETEFVDRFPASDVDYTYRVRTQTSKGLGTVESAPAAATETIHLNAVVLSAAAFDVELRAILRYVDSSKVDHIDDTATVLPWGQRRPVVYLGEAQYRTFTGSFSLINDSHGQAAASLAAVRAVHRASTVCCYRDERGRKLFGVIRLQEDDRRIRWYVITLTMTETSFSELGVNG